MIVDIILRPAKNFFRLAPLPTHLFALTPLVLFPSIKGFRRFPPSFSGGKHYDC
jgi:hypothetical protein